MKVIITFTFCCDNLRKSKFMALEKPGKLGEFFSPTLWPPRNSQPVYVTEVLSIQSLNRMLIISVHAIIMQLRRCRRRCSSMHKRFNVAF